MRRIYSTDNYRFLPNTFREVQRQEFEYHALRQALKRPFVSPISSRVHRILNVGCGAGMWVREVAHAYPRAYVIGYDNFPPALNVAQRGQNYHFQQGNLLASLPFDDGFFDFTCQRLISLALPVYSLPLLVSELLRVTRRGGWIEVLDVQPQYTQMGKHMRGFQGIGMDILESQGIVVKMPFLLRDLCQQLGLHHMHVLSYEQPVGAWLAGREREGLLVLNNFMAAAPYFKDLYCSADVMCENEFDRHLTVLPEEIMINRTLHHWSIIYGQR